MLLLDTHVLIWAVAEPEHLSNAATEAIRESRKEQGVAIAAITLWELAMLFARGSIRAYGTIDASIRLLTSGITVKPLTVEIATLATQFPASYPQDPADRLIGATARAEGMMLVTRDQRLRSSPLLQTIW